MKFFRNTTRLISLSKTCFGLFFLLSIGYAVQSYGNFSTPSKLTFTLVSKEFITN